MGLYIRWFCSRIHVTDFDPRINVILSSYIPDALSNQEKARGVIMEPYVKKQQKYIFADIVMRYSYISIDII